MVFTKQRNYLICKKVIFYSQKDEDVFFEWIKKIKCIEHFEGVCDELYLNLIQRQLTDDELRDIIALFYRYKIDIKQLQRFVNEENKEWLCGKPYGYWHTRMFGNKKKNR